MPNLSTLKKAGSKLHVVHSKGTSSAAAPAMHMEDDAFPMNLMDDPAANPDSSCKSKGSTCSQNKKKTKAKGIKDKAKKILKKSNKKKKRRDEAPNTGEGCLDDSSFFHYDYDNDDSSENSSEGAYSIECEDVNGGVKPGTFPDSATDSLSDDSLYMEEDLEIDVESKEKTTQLHNCDSYDEGSRYENGIPINLIIDSIQTAHISDDEDDDLELRPDADGSDHEEDDNPNVYLRSDRNAPLPRIRTRRREREEQVNDEAEELSKFFSESEDESSVADSFAGATASSRTGSRGGAGLGYAGRRVSPQGLYQGGLDGREEEDRLMSCSTPAHCFSARRQSLNEPAASGSEDAIERKRQKMKTAASKGDYVLAGRLQEEVKRLEELQRITQEAAQQNDFIRAGRLQAQFKALTATDTKQEEEERLMSSSTRSYSTRGQKSACSKKPALYSDRVAEGKVDAKSDVEGLKALKAAKKARIAAKRRKRASSKKQDKHVKKEDEDEEERLMTRSTHSHSSRRGGLKGLVRGSKESKRENDDADDEEDLMSASTRSYSRRNRLGRGGLGGLYQRSGRADEDSEGDKEDLMSSSTRSYSTRRGLRKVDPLGGSNHSTSSRRSLWGSVKNTLGESFRSTASQSLQEDNEDDDMDSSQRSTSSRRKTVLRKQSLLGGSKKSSC